MTGSKILVIGASGSGKSTFAREIARHLDLTYIPTDPFYWDKDWQQVPDDVVRARVMEVLQRSEWVMDGNFDDLREEVWAKADCILWLNFPFTIVAWRVILRNLRWWFTREEIWSGNRMTFQHALNGIRHSLRSYWKKKPSYPVWLQEYPQQKVHIFPSSRAAQQWLHRQNHRL